MLIGLGCVLRPVDVAAVLRHLRLELLQQIRQMPEHILLHLPCLVAQALAVHRVMAATRESLRRMVERLSTASRFLLCSAAPTRFGIGGM